MCISSIYSRARCSFNDRAEQVAPGIVVLLSGPVRFLHTPPGRPCRSRPQPKHTSRPRPCLVPFLSFSTLPACFLIILGRSNNPRFTYSHAFYDFLSPFSRSYSHCITLTNYKLIKTSNNLSLQKRLSFFGFPIAGEHGLLSTFSFSDLQTAFFVSLQLSVFKLGRKLPLLRAPTAAPIATTESDLF